MTKIDDLTAELLAQPLDQFTSHRNTRAKQLKTSGQADLAAALSTLKKPSVPLWAANQVARSNGAVLRDLRQSAQALARTQAAAGAGRTNAARELRGASEGFQQKLDEASNAIAAALRQGQHPAGEEALRRGREIFRIAALKGGEIWDRLQKGALATEPQPADDVLEMFSAGTAATGGKSAERLAEQRAVAAAEKAARADAERAKQATATALRLRQEATSAAEAAKRAADRATAAEEEAARAGAEADKSRGAVSRQRG
ncbi:MAG TPA: hypothetical protein VG104_11540 [Candidatus Dormibacteraeota bacterium]|nr:hypothetical protein [Candidatus Dormibacteraeota bacterium]